MPPLCFPRSSRRTSALTRLFFREVSKSLWLLFDSLEASLVTSHHSVKFTIKPLFSCCFRLCGAATVCWSASWRVELSESETFHVEGLIRSMNAQ